MREESLPEPAEEHRVELETLRRVHRHEQHRRRPVPAGLRQEVFRRQQRHLVQELRRPRFGVLLLELPAGAPERFQVLLPLFVPEVMGEQAGVVEGGVHRRPRPGFRGRGDRPQILQEAFEPGGDPGCEPTPFEHLPGRRPERPALLPGDGLDPSQGSRADAAGPGAERTPKRIVVVRADRQPHLRHRVLHFFPFVEPEPADDEVGDAPAGERLLERPALRARPVQHRARPSPGSGLEQLLGDPAGLGHLAAVREEPHRRPQAPGRPQRLLYPGGVLPDQRVRGVEDLGGGAVVVFQPEGAGAGKVLAEPAEVPVVGPPERVDRLVVVPDHEDIAVRGQQPDEAVLHRAGVLVLVHEQVPHPPLDELPRRPRPFQELAAEQDQVVEIHRPLPGQLFRVAPGDLPDLPHPRLPVQRVRRRHEGLPQGVGHPRLRDLPRHLRRFQVRVVEPLLPDLPEDLPGVVAPEDREPGGQGGFLVEPAQPPFAPEPAQQAEAEGVEGRSPHPIEFLPAEPAHPVAHLPRRLVREGHRQDGSRVGAVGEHPPGDAPGQHPRLPGPGPGEHQRGAGRRGHRLPLSRVQPFQYGSARLGGSVSHR